MTPKDVVEWAFAAMFAGLAALMWLLLLFLVCLACSGEDDEHTQT